MATDVDERALAVHGVGVSVSDFGPAVAITEVLLRQIPQAIALDHGDLPRRGVRCYGGKGQRGTNGQEDTVSYGLVQVSDLGPAVAVTKVLLR